VAEFTWLRPAVALLALAGAVGARPAMAATGEELYATCAPPDANASKVGCYAYIRGIIDDSKLIDGDVDARIIREIGRFCLRPEVTRDQIYDAVMRELRASPRSRKYAAALHVRMALVQAFPCPPMRPPPRGKPQP
jgi:hypothetical protein